MPVSLKSSLTSGALLFLLLLLNSFSHVAAQTNSDDLVRISRNPGAKELSAFCAPKKGPFSRHTCKFPDPSEALLSILRKHNLQGFCKSFIDINPKVTSTITTTVTTCGVENPKCTTITVNETVLETQEVKATLTADIPTVIIPTVATETAPTEHVVITITSTVGTPLVTPAPRKRQRGNSGLSGPNMPGFLKPYYRYRISSACSELIKDQIKTTTVYQTATSTVAGTAPSSTLTITAHVTNTLVVTVTPGPVTITNTVSTTTMTNTETSTTTTTICPNATPRATLLGVNTPTKLELGGSDVNSVVKCCSECYYRPSGGCAAWVFFASSSGGVCGLALLNNGATDQAGQCPLGLSNFEMGFASAATAADQGGRGPCAGTNTYAN